VCFNTVDKKSCEIFDGSKSTKTFSTTYTHESGGLGLYKNQPATVGCYSDHTDAETLQFPGWSAIPDQPESVLFFHSKFKRKIFTRALSGHSLIGLKNGAMLQLGGKVASTGAFRTAIWQLKGNEMLTDRRAREILDRRAREPNWLPAGVFTLCERTS
jgi:hypothetical protein